MPRRVPSFESDCRRRFLAAIRRRNLTANSTTILAADFGGWNREKCLQGDVWSFQMTYLHANGTTSHARFFSRDCQLDMRFSFFAIPAGCATPVPPWVR